jgi:hypothetical protein
LFQFPSGEFGAVGGQKNPALGLAQFEGGVEKGLEVFLGSEAASLVSSGEGGRVQNNGVECFFASCETGKKLHDVLREEAVVWERQGVELEIGFSPVQRFFGEVHGEGFRAGERCGYGERAGVCEGVEETFCGMVAEEAAVVALVEEKSHGVSGLEIEAEPHLIFSNNRLERKVGVSFEQDWGGPFCVLDRHVSAEYSQRLEVEGGCPLLPFPAQMGEEVGRLKIQKQICPEAFNPAAGKGGDSVGGCATGFKGFPLIRGDPVRVVEMFRTVHVSPRGRRIAGPVQFNYRCLFAILLYAAN